MSSRGTLSAVRWLRRLVDKAISAVERWLNEEKKKS